MDVDDLSGTPLAHWLEAWPGMQEVWGSIPTLPDWPHFGDKDGICTFSALFK